jgi:hypothetical protein
MKARRSLLFLSGVLIAICFLMIGSMLVVKASPAVGAYGADFLRKIVGNQVVVAMEDTLFKLEDSARNLEYKVGLAPATSPWSVSTGSKPFPTVTLSPYALENTTKTPVPLIPNTGIFISPTPTPIPTPTLPPVWMPPPVTPLGSLQGVAVWQPFIQDPQGNTVAYRTFVQPDPTRPYALTGIVALDLEKIRLHFVLGTAEPYAPGVAKQGTGQIPAQDLVPGKLLAAFNGGFKYQHGNFGAMLDGYVSAPPQDGMATVAIYQDGHIRMGVWGAEIDPSSDMVAFRQNGALVIQNGAITPAVSDSKSYWGYTVSKGTATWRSGLAISQDGKTLYYFAGNYLDINALSQAMMAVKPQTAMQLDINDFWVHFTAFQDWNGKIVSQALFPKYMSSSLDRYLHTYSRDFFYITTP